MKILFCLLMTAHAGVFKNLCERCLDLIIKDDTHQFEECSVDFVIRSADSLVTASRWRSLNKHEATMLEILLKELRQRSALGSDDDRTKADLALIRLSP